MDTFSTILRLAVLAVLITLSSMKSASASIIALSVTPTTSGNQGFGGSLGIDFDVNSAIQVTSLGAFDADQDGMNRLINVAIFDRTTQTVVGTTIQINSADALTGGHRFETLATPLNLAAGFQGTIVAWGYGAGEQNGNGFLSPFSTLNDGGGLISFGNSRYSGTPGAFPTTVDGGGADQYGAGSFEYQAASGAIPEPTTLAIWSILGGIGLVVGHRRRRRKAA